VHQLSDIKDKFRLVKEEVVDSPTWDKALRIAERLIDHRGPADLPTPPEQAKLCRDVAKKGRELRDAIRDYEARLREVCTWAGVAPDSSARIGVVSALSAWLDELLADMGNASRTRRLAALHGDGRLEGFIRVRATLPGEAKALTDIAGQRNAVTHLDSHGDEDDRTAVVVRLRNLLADSVMVALLADKAPAWIEETKQRFMAVATSAAVKAREQGARTDVAEQRLLAERQAREAAEMQQRAAEATAAAAAEAQAQAERQLAAQRQREESERSRTRIVAGSRETIGAAVQAELAKMLQAFEPGTQLRVRIAIDPLDPVDP
jgi:hypothetical protein